MLTLLTVNVPTRLVYAVAGAVTCGILLRFRF